MVKDNELIITDEQIINAVRIAIRDHMRLPEAEKSVDKLQHRVWDLQEAIRELSKKDEVEDLRKKLAYSQRQVEEWRQKYADASINLHSSSILEEIYRKAKVD